MKRYFIIFLFILICSVSTAQREKIKTYYKNRQVESKGSMYTYSVYSNIKSLPKKFRYFGDLKKKGKEWKYWYQNGELKRIENYRLIKDNNPNDLPDGVWMYFNDQGIKYREETYLDGVLIKSAREIYKGSMPAGRITLQNGITDTTLQAPLIVGLNLIINPEFDYFYYKPVPVIYDGRSRIEEWIPFWTTPGIYTPDYLSNLRTIDVLSYHYLFDFTLPDKFSYAGFALYKRSESYSEYIQGKLIKPLISGQKYCLKVSVAQPSYSGFSVNRIAFYLSPGPVKIDESNESSIKPQIILPTSTVDNKQFITLCDFFVAEGGEQFISIGRFTSAGKLDIVQRENILQSNFGIENSAYYILNRVELNEIQDTMECYCKDDIIQIDTNKTITTPEILLIDNDLARLKEGNSVILKNVNFEFDRYNLLQSSESILKTLLTFLNDNPEVRLLISGHTDDTGSEEYNLELSVNRAKSVYYWLINNGIDQSRLQFSGFGKSLPLYKETGEKFRALNRRVEVRIIDNSSRPAKSGMLTDPPLRSIYSRLLN
jgi:OmpA-OmpF porin, OOP family